MTLTLHLVLCKIKATKALSVFKSIWLLSKATINLKDWIPAFTYSSCNLPLHKLQLFSFQWLQAMLKELKVTKPGALIRGLSCSVVESLNWPNKKRNVSCYSPHAFWSQQQISRLTNGRLVLNSRWIEFRTHSFSKSLKSLVVDQSNMLHISRCERKQNFADHRKTEDTAVSVLQTIQKYLMSERRVLPSEHAVVGVLFLWERPLFLLAGQTTMPPAFLSSSAL